MRKTKRQRRRDRRQFLKLAGSTGLGMLIGGGLASGWFYGLTRKLIESPPVLQCPTPTSINVVWAVGQPATGHIEYGTDPSRLDQVDYGELFGYNSYGDRFLQFRLENLQPNTRYFYRTATSFLKFVKKTYPIRHPQPVFPLQKSEAVFSDVHTFETPGPVKEECRFSVINDTHENMPAVEEIMDRLGEVSTDYVIWNGDLCRELRGPDQLVRAVMKPAGKAFATDSPLVFVPGNHDNRGPWARNLLFAMMPWIHDDRQDLKFGRNFVIRSGPLAMIGLDTGEDRSDADLELNGMANYEQYRVDQVDWLRRALNRPEVREAPFVVAFCHIPLLGFEFHNETTTKWNAHEIWGSLLSEHQVQLVISGHIHRFSYEEAAADRSWAQVTGGGPKKKHPYTIIHGRVGNDSMEIVVEDLAHNTELGRWTYPRRFGAHTETQKISIGNH